MSVKSTLQNPKGPISGAEAVVRSLVAEGADLIYGYPGGAIMPVYDELYKFQEHINHVLVRHEQGAAHAAQGFARVSGQVGVCMATSGPGATNLVTGIADAMIDSTPLVCITGQVPSHLLGSDAFQETDIMGFQPLSPNGVIKLPTLRKFQKSLQKHFISLVQDVLALYLLTSQRMLNLEQVIFHTTHVQKSEATNPFLKQKNPI